MTTNVCIDLETLGTSINAAIIAIGAVKFDASGVFDRIYIPVDPASCQKHFGMAVEADTVMWWLHADRAQAREALLAKADEAWDLQSALNGFSAWFGDKSLPTWGNGATFDNVIMDMAYKRVDHPKPWTYKHDRCYRTMRNIFDPMNTLTAGFEDLGLVTHQAADDAEYQARHLIEMAKMFAFNLA